MNIIVVRYSDGRKSWVPKGVEALDFIVKNFESIKALEEVEDLVGTTPTIRPDEEKVTYLSSVDALHLSKRVRNLLRNAHIETIGQLAQCTEYDMLRMKELGRKSLRELRDSLEAVGLGFSDI